MKHFIIACKYSNDNFYDVCVCNERSEMAIKNAIINIPILKSNNNYLTRCTRERDLESLYNMESLSKKKNGIKIH